LSAMDGRSTISCMSRPSRPRPDREGPGVRSIVYLCRGHGYAHAARARLILPELWERVSSDGVEFASACTGLDYLRTYDVPCIDLGIEDAADQSADAGARLHDFLDTRPECGVVLADEFLRVPRICAGLGLPCVLLTCSFHEYERQPLVLDFMGAADHIVLADWPEVHPVPPALAGRTTATGPIVRRIRVDRTQARAQLGLAEADFVATVAFGSLHPAKALDLRVATAAVVRAWQHAPAGARLVMLFDAEEASAVLGSVPDSAGISWVGRTSRADRYYRASDIVFSAGTGTTSELVCNGVPTVAVCPPGPSENRSRAEYLASIGAIALADGDETGKDVWAMVEAMLAQPPGPPPQLSWGDPAAVAALAVAYLSKP
jgi:hypothetical protein